jgi:hypothetical protein
VGEDHDGPSLIGGGWGEERSITLGGYGYVVENGWKVGEEVGGTRASTKETGESREIGALWRRDPSHGPRTLFLVLARVEDTEGDGRSSVGRGCGGGRQVGGWNLDVDSTDSMRPRVFWECRGRVQAREEGHHGDGGRDQSNVGDKATAEMKNSRWERELQQVD